MLYTIQNEVLTVKIEDQGAELQSVVCDGTEYLWQGDAQWWTGRAPILFPIIGKLKGGAYRLDGKQYSLANQGFARRSKFTVANKSEEAITFSLCDSEDTRSIYPFAFELLTTYELIDRSLRTRFRINNKTDREMYFSIGGHPAFNCPLFSGETFEDYEIIFDKKETAGTHIITEGLVSDQLAPFFDESNLITLNHDLFNKYQTIVLSNLKSTIVTLRSRNSGKGVTMDFSGFPYFGIWAPPGAPFVCLEPWQGVDDSPVTEGNLREKTGTIKLPPEAEHTCNFTISL
jgi:galactose mutarotase-like enzyme